MPLSIQKTKANADTEQAACRCRYKSVFMGLKELEAVAIVRLEAVNFVRPQINFALRDISFSVEAGERLALVGPNAAGKSTICRLINGLLQPASGSIYRHHENCADLSTAALRERARAWPYVFQNSGLIPHKSVWAHLCLVYKLAGKQPDNARIEKLLTYFDLMQHRQQKAAALSGGQMQKTALSMALVLQPELLLLDEFSSFMDEHSVTAAWNLLLELQEEQHFGIIFVTHDAATVRKYATGVLQLSSAGTLQRNDVGDFNFALQVDNRADAK